LLKEAGIQRPLDAVMERLILRKGSAMAIAETPHDAFVLYEWAKNLPSTSTKRLISKSSGYQINGPTDFNSDLYVAFDAKGGSMMFKLLARGEFGILLESALSSVEVKPRETIHLDTALIATPTHAGDDSKGNSEIVAAAAFFGKDNLVPCTHLVATNDDGHTVTGLIMPKFTCDVAATLGQFTFGEEMVLKNGRDMVSALTLVHECSYVHMDIKEGNIFVNVDGVWHLGDFGSCVEEGETVTSTTASLLYCDVAGKPARFEYDWYMLAGVLVRQLDHTIPGDSKEALLAAVSKCELPALCSLLTAMLTCNTKGLML
jgi:hypothetical protein